MPNGHVYNCHNSFFILSGDEVECHENSSLFNGDVGGMEIQTLIKENRNGTILNESSSILSTLGINEDAPVGDIAEGKPFIVAKNKNQCSSDLAVNDDDERKEYVEIVSDNSSMKKKNIGNCILLPAAIHETKSKGNKD